MPDRSIEYGGIDLSCQIDQLNNGGIDLSCQIDQ